MSPLDAELLRSAAVMHHRFEAQHELALKAGLPMAIVCGTAATLIESGNAFRMLITRVLSSIADNATLRHAPPNAPRARR